MRPRANASTTTPGVPIIPSRPALTPSAPLRRRARRTRWKSENENNNVLKNYGYHLEHNFGHGQQYLALVLVMLNVLAFLYHTVLDLCDTLYRQVRTELVARS